MFFVYYHGCSPENDVESCFSIIALFFARVLTKQLIVLFRKWFAQFIRNFYSPEAAALSLIIVACKLLLGIDDETEWEMENELIPCVNDGKVAS